MDVLKRSAVSLCRRWTMRHTARTGQSATSLRRILTELSSVHVKSAPNKPLPSFSQMLMSVELAGKRRVCNRFLLLLSRLTVELEALTSIQELAVANRKNFQCCNSIHLMESTRLLLT